jgi:hypothetical protein
MVMLKHLKWVLFQVEFKAWDLMIGFYVAMGWGEKVASFDAIDFIASPHACKWLKHDPFESKVQCVVCVRKY